MENNNVTKKFMRFCDAQPKCEKCPLYYSSGPFCGLPWDKISEEQWKTIKSIINDEEINAENCK